MEILWPPTYFTDGNKTISLFDIYYTAYLSSISYAVILFQGNNGILLHSNANFQIFTIFFEILTISQFDI